MNCAIHSDIPATAYCRTCGKALCATCKHDVRGVIFCEDCIARRLSDTVPAASGPAGAPTAFVPPPDRGPSAALAAMLGFIPGVGAMYNGQFVKALIHVTIFASLIFATDRIAAVGVFIPFFIFYMVFDAYTTARARQTGAPLPDPFGFERMGRESLGTGAPPMTASPSTANAVMPGGEVQVPPSPFHNAPTGAIILIGMGVLFLLDNIGLFSFHWMHRLWPLILIVIGVWTWVRRQGNRRCPCPRCRFSCAMGPAVLVTLGVLFLIDTMGLRSFHYTWPMLLIVIGVVQVMRHNASAEGHIPRGHSGPGPGMPPPPPASGMQPPPGPPPGSSARSDFASMPGSVNEPGSRGIDNV